MKKRIIDSFFPLVTFLIFSLSLGSLYLKNVGPQSVGDYDMHVYNTYVVATGQVKRDFINDPETNGIKKMTFRGPANILSLNGADFEYPDRVLSPFSKDPKLDTQVNSYKNTSNKEVEKSVRTQYPPLNWVIPAMGLKLGLLLHTDAYTSWQFARVANLVGFIIIIVLAIVFAPKGKWLFASIGSFPLSVFLASSVSADAVNISVSALFVALIMNLRNEGWKDKQISNWQISWLMILVVVFFNLKVAYVPMLILILLIPNSFYSFKKKFFTVGLAGIVGLISYLWWSHVYSTVLVPFTNLSDNVHYIEHHFGMAMYAVFAFVVNMPIYLLSGIGNSSGWSKLGTLTSLFAIFILVITIIFNVDSLKGKNVQTLKEKFYYYLPILLGILAYVGSIFIMVFVLLMTWTKVYPGGFGTTFIMTDIQGVQMRYFLPVMPLFALLYSLKDDRKLRI